MTVPATSATRWLSVRGATVLLMCLAAVALGGLLRVRVFLYVGAGFAAASVALNLLRFGLAHSQFWAFYLTVLGLGVLAVMVVTTVQRERLLQLRGFLRATVREWE